MITIVSFGYGHTDRQPPTAHVTFDVRDLFRDPHVDPAMRQLTGIDDAVVASVFAQPGANDYVYTLVDLVKRLHKITPDVTVAVGCVGGRHRSVVIARALTARLAQDCLMIKSLTHRDMHLPVLTR